MSNRLPAGLFSRCLAIPPCHRHPFDQTLLDRLDLEVTRIGRTFRNFPPAIVYRVSGIKNLRTFDWRFS